jgi:hypothetical protein
MWKSYAIVVATIVGPLLVFQREEKLFFSRSIWLIGCIFESEIGIDIILNRTSSSWLGMRLLMSSSLLLVEHS